MMKDRWTSMPLDNALGMLRNVPSLDRRSVVQSRLPYGTAGPWRIAAIVGLILALGRVSAAPAEQVGLIDISGAIGPATADYVQRAINDAAAQHDVCLIVQLDTPGGLLESMKQIVRAFYASPVPIVVYVAPAGATAASAGYLITLAANVAAMATSTSIA